MWPPDTTRRGDWGRVVVLQGALCWELSAWCWLRMAATKLFPGRAIRDAPRLLDTSEASKKKERSSETWSRTLCADIDPATPAPPGQSADGNHVTCGVSDMGTCYTDHMINNPGGVPPRRCSCAASAGAAGGPGDPAAGCSGEGCEGR